MSNILIGFLYKCEVSHIKYLRKVVPNEFILEIMSKIRTVYNEFSLKHKPITVFFCKKQFTIRDFFCQGSHLQHRP